MDDEIKEALERLSRRHDPSQDLVAAMKKRKRRREGIRRFVTAGTVMMVAAGSFILLTEAFGPNGGGSIAVPGQTQTGSATPTLTSSPTGPGASSTPPDCPPVSEGRYEAALSPASAAPGELVSIHGPLPTRLPDGSEADVNDPLSLEFWWNADPDSWEDLLPGRMPTPVGPGDVHLLGIADVTGQCEFNVSFQVPEAPAGQHTIVILLEGGGGWALYGTDSPTLQVKRSILT